MQTARHHLRKFAYILGDLSALAGSAALILGCGVIVIDVVGRYFGSPLRGSPDLVQLAFCVIVFGGLALCDREGGNVTVDLFADWFPDWLNHVFRAFGALIGFVVMALLAWQMLRNAEISILLKSSTNILNIPRAPFQWFVAGCCAIFCLEALVRLLDAVIEAAQRKNVVAR